MATKRFCDDCGIEIDYAAESKAEFDLKLKSPGGEYERRVSVEIDFGNADLCEPCVWKHTAQAAKLGANK